MNKDQALDLADSEIISADEDAETLAAIDEGVRDAAAGRVIPFEEVCGLLRRWMLDPFHA